MLYLEGLIIENKFILYNKMAWRKWFTSHIILFLLKLLEVNYPKYMLPYQYFILSQLFSPTLEPYFSKI